MKQVNRAISGVIIDEKFYSIDSLLTYAWEQYDWADQDDDEELEDIFHEMYEDSKENEHWPFTEGGVFKLGFDKVLEDFAKSNGIDGNGLLITEELADKVMDLVNENITEFGSVAIDIESAKGMPNQIVFEDAPKGFWVKYNKFLKEM